MPHIRRPRRNVPSLELEARVLKLVDDDLHFSFTVGVVRVAKVDLGIGWLYGVLKKPLKNGVVQLRITKRIQGILFAGVNQREGQQQDAQDSTGAQPHSPLRRHKPSANPTFWSTALVWVRRGWRGGDHWPRAARD